MGATKRPDGERGDGGRSVLFVGESWIKHTIHMKGMDHFISVEYEEGAGVFLGALAAQGFEITYVRSHEVSEKFPRTREALQAYAAVILSDIGSNSFLLTNETFLRSQLSVNRLQLLVDYVRAGGGLVKIGGYMSFSGIDGRARYGMSPLADIIPVRMLNHDDRVELPEGVAPKVVDPRHPLLAGLPSEWPALLGYNKTWAKPDAQVLVKVKEDPLMAVKEEGAGRVLAFMSDIAPHWAPPEFLQWPHYAALWANAVGWAARRPL